MERIIKAMEETYLLPSRELVPGGLEGITGQVCYSDYECLR